MRTRSAVQWFSESSHPRHTARPSNELFAIKHEDELITLLPASSVRTAGRPSDLRSVLERLSAGARRHIRCNLTCQFDLEVHDDAGDTVKRGWGRVGGVEWMRTDPWLEPDGGVLGLWPDPSGFHISANCDLLRADRGRNSTRTGAERLGTRRGCQSVEVCPALGAVVRS